MIKQLEKKVFNSNGTLFTINLQYFFNEKSSIDCLIVLNCKSDYQLLRNMIDCCESIIVADGGANHLYQSPNRDEQKVKWIVGDLDSIKPQIQDYYRNKNVQICKVWDQDHNDLQKSLMKGQQQNFHHFICFGALGGRMDHTLSSLHIGTKIGRNYSDMEIIFIGDGNLMIYLRPNITYNIILTQKIQRSGCGLITFSKVNKIVTKGFKWDLGPQNGIQSLEWGNFISTSNQFASNQVSIHSSEEIYFVCRIKIKQ